MRLGPKPDLYGDPRGNVEYGPARHLPQPSNQARCTNLQGCYQKSNRVEGHEEPMQAQRVQKPGVIHCRHKAYVRKRIIFQRARE